MTPETRDKLIYALSIVAETICIGLIVVFLFAIVVCLSGCGTGQLESIEGSCYDNYTQEFCDSIQGRAEGGG